MDTTDQHRTGLEIAIIGMVGRFPGANNLETFWQNLADGVEGISFFSDQELLASGVDPAALHDPTFVKAGGVLDNVECFDAAFFNYTPREAEIMDPQYRLFLESAWEALEHAGYTTDTFGRPIGVYAGVGLSDYLLNNVLSNLAQVQDTVGLFQMILSNDRDHLTTLASYKLNLTGLSVTVQSACSTSLVAVHLACQGLLSGDCDMALAGGVSIAFPQKAGYHYQQGGVLSPDGHCRAFDARAQGTVRGSGLGIVVLKRLADALEDNDQIYAVIKGSAANNDGSHKIGYTAPSIEGQAKVIRAAHLTAEIEAQTISYIEAHGTATPLGDPIEIAALTRAFGAQPERRGCCAIGSAKTNIGHLDQAAGIAGLIKTVLMLNHRKLPPSLHFERPNPRVDFANTPFYVNTRLTDWIADGTPRRAGVSSFGMGGTNAHVVLEEAPQAEATTASRPWHVLPLAAKTRTALDTLTSNLAMHLRRHPDLDLADVAYTLQVGRKAFDQRRVVVCHDAADAATALATQDPQRLFSAVPVAHELPVAFLFPGQGAQYPQMARELYEVEPLFRETIDRCAELLQPYLQVDLREVLYPGSYGESVVSGQLSVAADHGQRTTDNGQINQTQYAQPALFVVEYALARLWMAWNVQPAVMLGHSLGEYVAACLAGVFSLEDALALVATRGRLMQQLPGGAMLAVPLAEADLLPLLGPPLELAAVNTPQLCVVAGPQEAIAELRRQLTERGLSCQQLHTSHAFHSSMMDPILEAFTAQVRRMSLNPPQIPFLSNMTGTWITAAEATDPSYWARHLRQTIRFAEGAQVLLQQPDQIVLEVGPGRTLSTLLRRHPAKTAGQVILCSLRHPRDQHSDVAFLQQTLGRLWLAGSAVDWPALYADERRRRLPLPTYPFERQRYWLAPRTPVTHALAHGETAPQEITEAAYSANSNEPATYARPDLQQAYTAPHNEIERQIAAIWQESLGIEQIGIHDSFFELGGHSLLAVQVLSRLRDAFQIELPLNTLFEHPTVAAVATAIGQQQLEQADGAALKLLLAEIQQLSVDEIRTQLATEKQLVVAEST